MARQDLRDALKDPVPNLLAGLTVAVVALPLALAFGLIAFGPEVGPAAGLWSAILAGFLAAVLGGSRTNITGPTVVLAVFTGGLVASHGGFASDDALLFGFLAVALSGVFQVLFGLLRLAKAVEYMPYPVVTGYLNGIALIIFLSGLKDILGVQGGDLLGDVVPALGAFVRGAAPASTYGAALLAAAAVAMGLLWPRFADRLPSGGAGGVLRRVPGSLLALLLLSLAALWWMPGDALRRIGELPGALPAFSLDFGLFARHPGWIRDLLLGALGLAAISSIETLLSCVIADSVLGTRTQGDRELVAQGVANAVAGGLGASQASGAAVRTMVSIRNGGRTRLAGAFHALVLLALLFLGAHLAAYVPIAVLSGILIATGVAMVDWRALAQAHRSPKSDTTVMVLTTVVTVGYGVVEAVVVGVVLSAFLFIRRITELTDFVAEPEWTGTERKGMEGLEDDVLVYEIHGPLFFGAAARFTKTFERADLKRYKVVVFRMNAVSAMDETGLRSMEQIVDRLHRNGQAVLVSHLSPGPHRKFVRFGLIEKLGADNVVPTFADAMARARAILGVPAQGPSASPSRPAAG